jgi:2-methylcitrate dehydratase PrpD
VSFDASDPALILGRRAAAIMAGPVSSEARHAARRALLDWFATTLPGSILPPATLIAAALAIEGATGGAVSYVDGRRVPIRDAALINGTASHIVEFDDIFRDGGYHPGSPTMAAALALAQAREASLDVFQRAVIAGYEVGARIALAVQPAHYTYWHTTATVGTMGAAGAGACLLGCDAQGIAHAIALASSFAGGHQQSLTGSSMTKALHPGHAAEAGLIAALAAAQGVCGTERALDGAKGFAAATGAGAADWNKAFGSPEDGLAITRMTIKAHGCCGHIFPALDGLAVLARDVDPDTIATIAVAGYAATKSMCDRPMPSNAQEARFSAQYCLAAQTVLGGVRLAAFKDAALDDPRIRSLAARITVTEAPDLTAGYPARRGARLRVTLRDGRLLEHDQPGRRGDPEDPLTDAELIDKFDELAGSVLVPDTLATLRHTILTGNTLPGALPLAAKP